MENFYQDLVPVPRKKKRRYGKNKYHKNTLSALNFKQLSHSHTLEEDPTTVSMNNPNYSTNTNNVHFF